MRALIAIILLGGIHLTASAATVPASTNYVEGEVLVTFKRPLDISATQLALTRHSLKLERHFKALSEKRGQVVGFIQAKGRTTASLVAELSRDPAVETVDPNYIRHVCGAVPNDAYFGQQWDLQNVGQIVNGSPGIPGADIKFPAAWALARPSTNEVVVGVIDTGIDYTHPDLVSNLWNNPFVSQDATNGFPGDLHGFNCADTNANIFDSGIHGTHVSGILAAVGDNMIGISGADFQARIMVLKVSDDGETIADSSIIEAINFAVMMHGRGINVVALNASFAGGGNDNNLRTAIETAGDAGMVFCAAADNFNTDIDTSPTYPASYDLPNMIVVAASDQTDSLASFSNYGANSVHLAAPGVNILSTVPVYLASTTASVMEQANNYSANGLTNAGATTGLTATIYDCGSGQSGDFPPAVSNNIALISRASVSCSNEVYNAMAAGALGAIIYNNASGNFTATIGTPAAWIPAVAIAQADGLAIKVTLPATGSLVNAANPAQMYEYLQGTSQSTALASAAVAFSALNFPNETMAQRISRILNNVDVTASLFGKVITGGRLNLLRTVDTDTNGLPDWWELQYFGTLLGTNANTDPDHDGFSISQEWQAGINPTNPLSRFQISSVTHTASGPSLNWQGVANRAYLVTRGTNVINSIAYSTMVTNLVGQPGAMSWIDTNTVGRGPYYYRLGVGLDPFP